MKEHMLKVINPYFEDIWLGRKTFEVRRNDRNFQTGDTLNLCEWSKNAFTERAITATIKYILPGGDYGIDSDYCVMGLTNIHNL